MFKSIFVLCSLLVFINTAVLFAQNSFISNFPVKACNDYLPQQVMTMSSAASLKTLSSQKIKVSAELRKSLENRTISTSEDIEFFSTIANAFFNNGDYLDAKKLYFRVLEIDPYNIIALYNLGRIYTEEGTYSLAINYFLKINEINPTALNLHSNIGYAYWLLDKNNAVKAEDEFALEMRFNPSTPYPYVNRALIYRFRGDDERAFQDYKKAFELSGGDIWFSLVLARFCEQMQVHKEEGIGCVNKILRLYPNSWRAWEIKAGFYYHEKKYQKAEKAYLHSLALFERATTYYELCWTYAKMGKFSLAKKMYDKAISMEQPTDLCYKETAEKYLKEKGIVLK